jgi:hypothetical protein
VPGLAALLAFQADHAAQRLAVECAPEALAIARLQALFGGGQRQLLVLIMIGSKGLRVFTQCAQTQRPAHRGIAGGEEADVHQMISK